ncbi:hypothetical protein BDV26DRAFT_147048 [Aspergillus bertholletiae]|uniref:Uncharacterized protein n=1 Tax=Aspergillus bertholletiae TaxID=1226010 RepID=A0A5N7AN10_9EURO|nr:hypothetical protein BDV26DRAFT_147048 [Aspergillus bertholletiae]
MSRALGPPRYIGVGDGGSGGTPLRGIHLDALGGPPLWGFRASIEVPGALEGLY